MALSARRALMQPHLEAASRELASLIAQLVEVGADDGVQKDVSQAADHLTRALRATLRQSAPAEDTPDEQVQEAYDLLAEAARERDIAEAQFGAAQDEHHEQLRQFEELSRAADDASGQLLAAEQLAAREADILRPTQELLDDVARLREQVETKSQRLVSGEGRNHILGLRVLRLLRRREACVAENAIAREVLELERRTEEHLKHIDTSCDDFDAQVEQKKADVKAKMVALREEWLQRWNDFIQDSDAVEDRLADVETFFAERWNGSEAAKQERLRGHLSLLRKHREGHDRALQALEQSRGEELTFIQQEVAQQALIVARAREEVTMEMSARLDEKRQLLRSHLNREQERCGDLRERHLQRASDLGAEARKYRGHIKEVKHNYAYQQREIASLRPIARPHLKHGILLRGCGQA